ncbi:MULTISPECIES: DUF3275 family protein [unclassified Brenneria]|uniref:DUF3275 family protein n=1 Tax=unclassified Brenneria TaxID=2634434 RepID=UPI0018F08902|nr:DUF3275 family protein [Brenneria sp. L3-3C-1]MBJ7223586.1 DUF3275 family protein [Brenneria sp. L3-3C-1]MEE3644828.1 DUF3275 family protein [Brenneria sp. L3_3C_1]
MAKPATMSGPPVTVGGHLAIVTIHGQNGPFKVGNLVTPIGKFTVKDPELDQYPEGKYQGEFIVRYCFIKPIRLRNGGIFFEHRANLDGMTLSGIDKLSKAEARAFVTHDVDPLDEETSMPPAIEPTAPTKPKPKPKSKPKSRPATVPATEDPSLDTTPFGVDLPPAAVATSSAAGSDDAALFGILWPLGESVKLDSTIDRRTLRLQIARLGKLGYEIDPIAQQWNRKPEPQAA